MFIVYKLQNKVNNKVYIGISSRSLSARWSEHKKRAKEGVRNSRLYNAIRKYGEHNFIKEVIDSCESESQVRELETKYIIEFDSYNNGYNSNLGGFGFLVFPDEIKRKTSEAQIGKVISEETKQRMSQAKLGDKSCAKNFGEFTSKGALSPLAKTYQVQHPCGKVEQVTGLRAFCRENNISVAGIKYGRNGTKGYKLLERSTTRA
jgi:group I intron endonuclease